MRLTGFHRIVSFRVNYCVIVSSTLSEIVGLCKLLFVVKK